MEFVAIGVFVAFSAWAFYRAYLILKARNAFEGLIDKETTNEN